MEWKEEKSESVDDANTTVILDKRWWTQDEYQKFLDGMKLHTQDKKDIDLYRVISDTIPNRDGVQVQSYVRDAQVGVRICIGVVGVRVSLGVVHDVTNDTSNRCY